MVGSRKYQRQIIGYIVALIAFSGIGCTSFDRQWRQVQNYAYPDRELAGCWEGQWHSDFSQRKRTVRVIITREGEHSYRAHFRSTSSGVFPYEFEVPLEATQDGKICALIGQGDLGREGGICICSGEAEALSLQMKYSGAETEGSFVLNKVQECSQRCIAGGLIPKTAPAEPDADSDVVHAGFVGRPLASR